MTVTQWLALNAPEVLAPDDLDPTDLLAGPASATTTRDLMPPVPVWRPPYSRPAYPDADDDDEGQVSPTVVREAVVLQEALAADEQPRWPAGTPGGKGGQFMRVGETFTSGGKTWQIAHIVKGKVYAHEASGTYGAVETKAFATTKVGGETQVPGATYKAPVVPVGDKMKDYRVTTVRPEVDSSTHDPSIPIPANSDMTPEQWQRFGKIDQEHYVALQERFGAHKPGHAQKLVDAANAAAEAAVKSLVTNGYTNQYGSSSGMTLSLAASVEKTGYDAELREKALALQAEHAAAVQWDLYNRVRAPDLLVTHKSKSYAWSAEEWFNNCIKGNKPVFSGLSTSWNFRKGWWAKRGVMMPMAIRHVLLSTQSAHGSSSASSFSHEMEIASPLQLKLDETNSLAFDEHTGAHKLTANELQWLDDMTNSPATGELFYMLMEARKSGVKLPVPPQPPNIVMDGALGSKTWVDPPDDAALPDFDASKLPPVNQTVVNTELPKDLPWNDVDDNGVPQAVSGVDADPEAGQYLMGLKGTLYWIGPDPGVGGNYPLRIHKIVDGKFNGENFAYNPDQPGYYLDHVFDMSYLKDEGAVDEVFDPSAWAPSSEAKFLEDYAVGEKFKVNGIPYEVTATGDTSVSIKNLEDGATGKINGTFKTAPLVAVGEGGVPSALESLQGPKLGIGAHVKTASGKGKIVSIEANEGGVSGELATVALANGGEMQIALASAEAWSVPQAPVVGMTIPYERDDGTVVKAVVTKVGVVYHENGPPTHGDVQINLKPGKVLIKRDDWDANYAQDAFDPGSWNISADKTKLRDMAAGDKFQGSQGNQTIRPYEVIHVPPNGPVWVRNMDTGKVSAMSRHVSFRKLEAKLPEGSAAEGMQDTPDAPAASVTTPVSTDPGEHWDPAKYELGPMMKLLDAPAGTFLKSGTYGEPLYIITNGGPGGQVSWKNLATGHEHSHPYDDLALTAPQATPLHSYQLKSGETAVEHDPTTWAEGELTSIGEMAPGTTFKTNSKKGPAFYKLSRDGEWTMNLATGKSYPAKKHWKGTVLTPPAPPQQVSAEDVDGLLADLPLEAPVFDDEAGYQASKAVGDDLMPAQTVGSMAVGTWFKQQTAAADYAFMVAGPPDADGMIPTIRSDGEPGKFGEDYEGYPVKLKLPVTVPGRSDYAPSEMTIAQMPVGAWYVQSDIDLVDDADNVLPYPAISFQKVSADQIQAYDDKGAPLGGPQKIPGDGDTTVHAVYVPKAAASDASALIPAGRLQVGQKFVNNGPDGKIFDSWPEDEVFTVVKVSAPSDIGGGETNQWIHVEGDQGHASSFGSASAVGEYHIVPIGGGPALPTPDQPDKSDFIKPEPGITVADLPVGTFWTGGAAYTSGVAFYISEPGKAEIWINGQPTGPAAGLNQVVMGETPEWVYYPAGVDAPEPMGDASGPVNVPAMDLVDKPGTVVVHQGETVTVAGQSDMDSGMVKIIYPDGSAGNLLGANTVMVVPGEGPTVPLMPGDKVQLPDGSKGTISGIDGTEGVLVSLPSDVTVSQPAHLLKPVLPLTPGAKVHVNDPGKGSGLYPPTNTMGYVKSVRESDGWVQLHGSVKWHHPDYVTTLESPQFSSGQPVETADGELGNYVGMQVGVNGQAMHVIYTPLEGDVYVPVGQLQATNKVWEPEATPVEAKTQTPTAYDDLTPGDVTEVGQLRVGDRYTDPDSSLGITWEVVSLPEGYGPVKVRMAASSGQPVDSPTLYDAVASAPAVLSSKAGWEGEETPTPPAATVSSADLPDAVLAGGFLGFKSHKGSGGKWSHHQVQSMPVGTIFADLNGKQWKVKQSGADPVITDGEQLFKVNGKLRGKDLSQPAVKQNANLVDKTELPVAEGAEAPELIDNVDDKNIESLNLKTHDTFTIYSAGQGIGTWQVKAPYDATYGLAARNVDTKQVRYFKPWMVPTAVPPSALSAPPAEVVPDEVLPSVAAAPSLYTQPVNAAALNPGDTFTLAPGSSKQWIVNETGFTPEQWQATSELGETATFSAGDQVFIQPEAPVEPSELGTPVEVGEEEFPQVTVEVLPDGKFRYRVGDFVHYQASAVDYVAVAFWQADDGSVISTFHKTLEAAQSPKNASNPWLKNKLGWVKIEEHEPDEVEQPVDPATVTTVSDLSDFAPPAPSAPAPPPVQGGTLSVTASALKQGDSFKLSGIGKAKVNSIGPAADPAFPGELQLGVTFYDNGITTTMHIKPDQAVTVDEPSDVLQPFSSHMGPGGVYPHPRLLSLQPGQLFTDKTGNDYKVVEQGEGFTTYQEFSTGKVYTAPNTGRVKATALPPDPGPATKAIQDALEQYGSLDDVPTTDMPGFSSATGENGKVKYPRVGHFKFAQVGQDANGAPFIFVASWLDQALVLYGGEYRIVPAATRVIRQG
jgi:hypothetical protein